MSGPKLVLSIFIIIILSLGGLLGFYFYINRTTNLKQAPIASTKPTFSGFDQVTLDNTVRPNNGINISYSNSTSTSSTTIATTTANTEEFLRLISAQPVAGHDFIIRDVQISTTSTSTRNRRVVSTELIRYVLKANGNIFETGTSSTSTTDRITNKTLPKIQEAFFNTKGDGLIIRNLVGNETIQTRYLSLKPESTTGTSTIQTVNSTNLPINITQITRSPDRTKIFYTRNTGNRGIVSNFDGGSSVNLFNSPYREWLLQWATGSTIFLNTKPSGIVAGYLYSLDSKTGTIKKVIGGGTGLTSSVSNDGKWISFAKTDRNGMQLNMYNIKEGSDWDLRIETLPEKCVWGNKYTSIMYCAIPKSVSREKLYPDDWYLGLVHFNDSLWKINIETGERNLLVDPEKQITLPLDIYNLKLSKNDDYLTFEDRNTYSLWGYKLKNTSATSTKK